MSKYRILVGTYALKEDESLFLYEWDPETYRFDRISALKGLCNPSYFVMNHEQDLIYAVQEDIPEGGIAVIRFQQDHFKIAQECSSYGSAPCFISLNQDETELFAANYMSGSVSLYHTSGNRAVLFQQEKMNRSGPNLKRQKSSHLHSGYFSGDKLYCCDLGGDTIDCFIKIPGNIIYTKETEIHMPPGSGPRHMLFPKDHPNLFYVICELDGYIRTVRITEKGYEIIGETDTLPPGTTFETRSANRAGALKESSDGRWIFATNRGTDIVTMLKKNKEGLLSPVSMISSGAEDPRDLEVLDHHLMIGHQKGKKITVLNYTDNGMLHDTGSRLDMSVSPVCIFKL